MVQATPAANAAGNAQPQSRQQSLRSNTRMRVKPVGSVPITFGGSQSIFLPNIGMLAGIFISVNAVINDAAPITVAPSLFGPWNLVKRVQVNTNLGAATIVDMSGYGAFLNANTLARRLAWDLEQSGSHLPTNDPWNQYPLIFAANVTKPLSFQLFIPIAANLTQNMALGLINLQAPQIQCSVQLQFGTLADLYTTTDAITIAGNAYISYVYWEIPAAMRNVALPAKILCRTIEQRIPFGAAGEVTYVVPRLGRLLKLIQTVTANGVLVTGGGTVYQGTVGANGASAGVDYIRLYLNQTDEVERLNYQEERMFNRLNYSDTELPAGSHMWNLFQAMGEPQRGDLRDTLDTQSISEIDAIVAIDSGVTLGANTNFLDNVRTVIQPFSA